MAELDQALGALDRQLGDGDVVLRRPVEGRGDDLALHRPLHVGDLLGTLVDQDDHEVALGVVRRDGVGDGLHHHRLAGLGRADDERALALADRHHQVDHARRQRARVGLEPQAVLRVERRQLGEVGPLGGLLRVDAVHAVEPDERVELVLALALALLADGARHGVAAAQAVPADLLHRDVDVVGTGEVPGRPDEAVVVEDVEDAADGDQHVVVAQQRLRLVAEAVAAGAAVAAPSPLAEAAPARAGLVVVARAEVARLTVAGLTVAGRAVAAVARLQVAVPGIAVTGVAALRVPALHVPVLAALHVAAVATVPTLDVAAVTSLHVPAVATLHVPAVAALHVAALHVAALRVTTLRVTTVRVTTLHVPTLGIAPVPALLVAVADVAALSVTALVPVRRVARLAAVPPVAHLTDRAVTGRPLAAVAATRAAVARSSGVAVVGRGLAVGAAPGEALLAAGLALEEALATAVDALGTVALVGRLSTGARSSTARSSTARSSTARSSTGLRGTGSRSSRRGGCGRRDDRDGSAVAGVALAGRGARSARAAAARGRDPRRGRGVRGRGDRGRGVRGRGVGGRSSGGRSRGGRSLSRTAGRGGRTAGRRGGRGAAGRGSRAALPGLDGLDELALAQPPGAGDAELAGHLLQLGQHHRGESAAGGAAAGARRRGGGRRAAGVGGPSGGGVGLRVVEQVGGVGQGGSSRWAARPRLRRGEGSCRRCPQRGPAPRRRSCRRTRCLWDRRPGSGRPERGPDRRRRGHGSWQIDCSGRAWAEGVGGDRSRAARSRARGPGRGGECAKPRWCWSRRTTGPPGRRVPVTRPGGRRARRAARRRAAAPSSPCARARAARRVRRGW